MSQTLLGFLVKEFKQVLRDPRMRILLFIMPMVQLTLFGVAISNEVKNIRLWVQVDNQDTILQHIKDRAILSDWFLASHEDRNADPFALLKANKIDAALIAPPGGLTRALGKGPTSLQFLINASNVVQAQAIEGYLKAITTEVLQDDLIKQTNTPPLAFAVRVLYNPSLETAYFMVPGVMTMIMCIITIVLTSMSITREKELGTFEMLISAPVSATEVILGKTIPYVVLGMSNVPLILAVAVFVFGVPMRGSLFILALASLAFVCTTVSIGTLISTFTVNQQQSTLASFLFLFPAILLSGVMFPLENMPEMMKWVSYFDPLAHFLSLLRNIMLKGGESHFVFFHISVLILMASTSVAISFRRFKTTLS